MKALISMMLCAVLLCGALTFPAAAGSPDALLAPERPTGGDSQSTALAVEPEDGALPDGTGSLRRDYVKTVTAPTGGYYSLLTSAQQQLYMFMYTLAENRVTGNLAFADNSYYTFTDTISLEDLSLVYYSFNRDMPEYFWVSNTYLHWPKTGNQTHFGFLSTYYSTPYSTGTDFGHIDTAAVEAMYSTINTESAKAVALCAGKTDKQKARVLFDWICARATYEECTGAHNIYGILDPTNKKAVCEGYAKLYKYLLGLCGIESYYVSGTGGGDAHGWNAVKLGGVWYDFDVTWADQENENMVGGSCVDYSYFAVPTSVMITTGHARATKNNVPLVPLGETTPVANDFMSDSSDFKLSGTALTRYSGPLGIVYLPFGITSVSARAFSNNVVDWVSGGYYLYGCHYLTRVVISEGVTSIAANAFYNCAYLDGVYLPSTVSVIDSGIYNSGCAALTTVYGRDGTAAETFAVSKKLTFKVMGDLDGNNVFNILDVIRLQQHLKNGGTVNMFLADFNLSRTVDSGDLSAELRFLGAVG